MIKIGEISVVLKPEENNPGGIYHQADFQIIGKEKKASVNVKWLIREGRIQGTTIKLSPGRGFGELLAILSEFQKTTKGKEG